MEPALPTDVPATDAGTGRPSRAGGIDWWAVGAGAVAGLVVLALAYSIGALLRRQVADFDESGWRVPLFVVVLVGYGLAGWVSERREGRSAPLTHGALAAVGAFVLWIPVRILIWLARSEDRGLLRGPDAALRVGQVFGHLVIATGIGMVGALLARRFARSSARQGAPASDPV